MRIGMDVGTTQCKQAVLDASGKPVTVMNSRGQPSTISAVYQNPDGSFLTGIDAREQGVVDPSRYVDNFKLFLGSTESLIQHGGSELTPTQATAALIGSLARDAEEQTGTKVEACVATCPANFKNDARRALIDAFQVGNGIEVLSLVPEPTAAAIAYATERASARASMLVFDFGGGTLDVSVASKEGPEVVIHATAGLPNVGGNDLTAQLEGEVLGQFESETGLRPTRAADPLFFLDLDQRLDQAKISLGRQPQVPIVLSFQGEQVVVTITQNQFESLIADLTDQSLRAVDEAMDGAGLRFADVNRLVMVGGTSRLPYIQRRLSEHTGLTPRVDIDPGSAISYGAAILAAAESVRHGRADASLPAPDVLVRDVTAHSVGCSTIAGTNGSRRLINSEMIARNTPIPCQYTDHFYLEEADQSEVEIEILQGEAEAERDDCLVIGSISLQGLPAENTRSRRITVDYVVDRNGMITATATDKVSGKSRTVSVDYREGVKSAQDT